MTRHCLPSVKGHTSCSSGKNCCGFRTLCQRSLAGIIHGLKILLTRQENPPGQNTLHVGVAVSCFAIRLIRKPDRPCNSTFNSRCKFGSSHMLFAPTDDVSVWRQTGLILVCFRDRCELCNVINGNVAMFLYDILNTLPLCALFIDDISTDNRPLFLRRKRAVCFQMVKGSSQGNRTKAGESRATKSASTQRGRRVKWRENGNPTQKQTALCPGWPHFISIVGGTQV